MRSPRTDGPSPSSPSCIHSSSSRARKPKGVGLRLLLDNQLSWKRIAEPLRRRGHDVLALQQQPRLEGLADEAVLELAGEEGRILVTRNSRDFAPILSRWARGERSHAGSILVWSLDHAEHRRIVAAVERLLRAYPQPSDWANVTRAI